ncbi:MAG TPA: hypothetical protein VHJ78_01675 [Actinomycetota bacterium]|nr:hypothetical protein [Actinomycetota bacterium]
MALILAGMDITAASAGTSSESTVRFCVNDRSRIPRIVDHSDACGQGEFALEWSTVGAQGLQRPQHPLDFQSPPGAPRVFESRQKNISITHETKALVSVMLPPGRWVLQAKVALDDLAFHKQIQGRCTMEEDQTNFSHDAPLDNGTIVMLDVAEFKTLTEVAMLCRTHHPDGAEAYVDDAVIVATNVSN